MFPFFNECTGESCKGTVHIGYWILARKLMKTGFNAAKLESVFRTSTQATRASQAVYAFYAYVRCSSGNLCICSMFLSQLFVANKGFGFSARLKGCGA